MLETELYIPLPSLTHSLLSRDHCRWNQLECLEIRSGSWSCTVLERLPAQSIQIWEIIMDHRVSNILVASRTPCCSIGPASASGAGWMLMMRTQVMSLAVNSPCGIRYLPDGKSEVAALKIRWKAPFNYGTKLCGIEPRGGTGMIYNWKWVDSNETRIIILYYVHYK